MNRFVAVPVAALACSGAFRGSGVPDLLDADGDGFAVADGDCDDADPAVSPLATDAPGDGIDGDCDGADDEGWPAATASPGDLRITEFLADPVGVRPELGEWFELTNTSSRPLDLDGLRVRDAGTEDFLVSGTLVLEPGGVAVIAGSTDPIASGGLAADLAWTGGFGLSNTEDALVLEAGGQVLDEVVWDAAWPQDAGVAASRDPSGDRWCPARDEDVYGIGGRGTPGASNPDCPPPFAGVTLADLAPGDLVITELMSDPAAVDGDHGEWFEVRNLRAEDVSLTGLSFDNDDGDDFEVDRALVVGAGGAVVFGSFVDPDVNARTPVDWEWRWAFGLRNSGGAVRMWYGTLLLDEVRWDPSYPDVEGASKSLDPRWTDVVENDDVESWCPASTPFGSGDLGSPGEENPPCP